MTKFATYNMFWGFDGTSLFKEFVNQAIFHGSLIHFWTELPSHESKFWDGLVRSRTSIDDTIRLVEESDPDVLALQEVLGNMHGEELEGKLSDLGYQSFAWGESGHHEGERRMFSMIASKMYGEELDVRIPYPLRNGTVVVLQRCIFLMKTWSLEASIWQVGILRS